jgi:membrane fusion protein, copper/silver efflux system
MSMNWATSRIGQSFPKVKNTLYQISLLGLLFLWVACQPSKEDVHKSHTADEHAAHTASVPDTSLADIVRSVNQTVISSQQTVAPIVKNIGNTIELNGYITEDPRRNQAVAIRIGGRVEKLYVKYNYQYIRKGEKVLDVYSPELQTSQEEYLYLLHNKGDENLISSAKQKLLLLGLSENQITYLEKTGKSAFTLSMYSPFSGYVILGSLSPNIKSSAKESSAEGMNMNAGASNTGGSVSTTQTNTELREGMYVNAGQTLFTVNDFKQVWAVLAIPADDQSFVGLHTPVQLTSEITPGKPFAGKINLIEPVFREGIQFMQARVYLDNPEEILKANSLINAEVVVGDEALMMVPNSSISDLGSRKIVWVKIKDTPSGKKIYEPRTVLTGIKTGDYTQIIQGLKADELIARQAGFLLDSESIVE